MLDSTTKRRIDDCRDILVGKVPDPKSQIDQITVALIYKFMHDMDQEAVDLGGTATFFAKHTVKVNGREVEKDYAQYAWPNLMAKELGGEDRVKLYAEALEKMPENPGLPQLFRDIFKNTFLPYRDPATLREFLKRIDEFTYDHSEKLGDAFEYLLSIMGSQGDAGQFRTPRHLIDFMTAVIDPQKHETILDPACGTAGFLISAYKHILRHNSSNHSTDDPLAFQLHGVKQEDLTVSAKKYSGDNLTPDDRKRLVKNLVGYDIDPGMVKLSLVNLYLHGFPEPHIHEYDTLTSTDRWEERFDVVLANPPFMSPKGGIQPHSKFGIPSTRSEVLFVDYIAEHLNPNGRALVVVPEGIIFRNRKDYRALRKKLVDEHYLVGVVSLPGGVFNPYSGVKTGLLWFDRSLAKKTNELLFIKVVNDGFDLGAQRTPITDNDLPEAFELLHEYKQALSSDIPWTPPSEAKVQVLTVEKDRVVSTADVSYSGDRYVTATIRETGVNMVALDDFMPRGTASLDPRVHPEETFELWSIPAFDKGSPEQTLGKDIGSSKKVVQPGDVLLSRIVPHIRRAWVVEPSSMRRRQIGSGEWIIFRSEDVDPHYLKRILVSDPFHEQFMRTITGVGGSLTRANPEAVREIQIPLPPLSEQEALVAEVEGYQRVIDGARHVVAHYKPRITIDPTWKVVELGEVCDVSSGGTPSRARAEYWGGRIPWVKTGEIDYAVITSTEEHITEAGLKGSSTRLYPKGTLLMAMYGQGITRGRVATLGIDATINQACAAIIPKTKKLSTDYLYLLLIGKYDELRAMSESRGGNQSNLSAELIRSLRIALPPLSVQERIVATLEEERRMVEAARALAARMEERVRERVARVWSPSRSASATERHIGSGTGVRPTLVATEAENYGSDEAPELELAVAADPVPSYGAAQAVVRRGPGRPPKGDMGTGNADAVIQGYLQAHPGWHGKAAILEATGVDAGAWNAAIKELLEAGKVERQGVKRGARYRGNNNG